MFFLRYFADKNSMKKVVLLSLMLTYFAFAKEPEIELEELREPASAEAPVPVKIPAKPAARKTNNDDVGGARNESFEEFINGGVQMEETPD